MQLSTSEVGRLATALGDRFGISVEEAIYFLNAQNITVEVPKDPLTVMFAMQAKLQERQGKNQGKPFTPWDGEFPIRKEVSRHMTEEVHYWLDCTLKECVEAQDWLPWKRWSIRTGNKQVEAEKMWSEEHIHEMHLELIDAWHFMMNAMLEAGIDSNKMYKLYCEKNGINHERAADVRY